MFPNAEVLNRHIAWGDPLNPTPTPRGIVGVVAESTTNTWCGSRR
jgi:hypothetical protein